MCLFCVNSNIHIFNSNYSSFNTNSSPINEEKKKTILIYSTFSKFNTNIYLLQVEEYKFVTTCILIMTHFKTLNKYRIYIQINTICTFKN
jgi:hypothetical protein